MTPHLAPLIFGVPNSKSLGMLASFGSSLLALFLYLLYYYGIDLKNLSYIYIIIYLFHMLVSMRVINYNILIIFRYLLLWFLPFICLITYMVWGGKVYLGPFGPEYQTEENLAVIINAGILGISGNLIGWTMWPHFRRFKNSTERKIHITPSQRSKLLSAGLFLSYTSGLLYLYNSGGIVGLNTEYATNSPADGIEINALNIFHYIGISIVLIAAYHKDMALKKYIIFLCIFSLLLGVLAGSRADYLPQSLILLVIAFGDKINSKIISRNISELSFMAAASLFVILFYFLASVIAYNRQGLPLEFLFSQLFSMDGGLIIEIYGHPVLFFETGNMMIGGFYSAIVNVDLNGYLLGASYVDYLLKIPPAFFGLDRPAGLDTMTEINGLIMSQGGIFELAEAYWNFGLFGCFFVPLIISSIQANLLLKGIKNHSIFFLVCYMVPGFMAFRAIWYQNFSYFRQATILILLFLVLFLFARWVISRSPQQYKFK